MPDTLPVKLLSMYESLNELASKIAISELVGSPAPPLPPEVVAQQYSLLHMYSA